MITITYKNLKKKFIYLLMTKMLKAVLDEDKFHFNIATYEPILLKMMIQYFLFFYCLISTLDW